MESLKHWLEIIAKNGQNINSTRYYSHKELELIVDALLILDEAEYPYPIRLKIKPLLHNLKYKGISHNHKNNIARFIISIINEYEIKEMNLDPDCF
jgi:HEPN domain-containing protein